MLGQRAGDRSRYPFHHRVERIFVFCNSREETSGRLLLKRFVGQAPEIGRIRRNGLFRIAVCRVWSQPAGRLSNDDSERLNHVESGITVLCFEPW